MSTEAAKLQLEAEMNTTQVRQGLKEVEGAAERMSRAVSESAGKAGERIDKMGGAGDGAAKKVKDSTSNIIASIQRTTAAYEAGERGSAKYYEAIAKQRGVDVNTLRPYLQQLDAAKRGQDAASASLGNMGTSAKQTAAALRGVPAQFTDIITSLQGGQAPMTVLLQQGGQLKDMFGGVGNAARALGGYVLGLVNPFTLVAGAALGVAIAYEAGAREERAFRSALILSGNQAGTTAGQLQQMAVGIDAVVGTQGRAAEALALFVQNGKVGAQNLQAFAAAALQFEDVTGQAVRETAKQFEELRKAPLEATLKLNDGMGYLTASVYEQIKALMEQGKVTEAANVAQKAYADTLAQRAGEMAGNLGLVERGWLGIKKAVGEAWDAIKSVGRTTGAEGQLDAVSASIAELEKGIATRKAGGYNTQMLDGELTRLRERQSLLQSETRLLARTADLQRQQADSIKARAEFDKAGERFLSDRVKMEREIAAARELGNRAGQTLVQIEERVAAIRKSYDKKPTGGGGTGMVLGESEVAAIRARVVAAQRELAELQAQASDPDGLGGKVRQLNEGERLAIKIKEELATGIKGVARANKEQALSQAELLAQTLRDKAAVDDRIKQIQSLNEARAKELQALGADAAAIDRKAAALEAENEAWGQSRVAVEAAALARMQANAADVAGFNGSADVVAALNAKTEAQRRYVDALKAAELKTFSQRGDEALRQAKELRDTYAEELQLVSLSALEREKIVAVRQVELKYSKLIADVERSSLSDAEKRAEVGKLVEAQGIESSAVVNRVMQADFARTSAQIEQSLTDALMRGFESGKDFAANLRDTIVNMFKTLVLRPIISAVVNPVAGAITGALGVPGAPGGGGAMGAISNLSSLYNTGSSLAGWLGLGAATGTGLAVTTGAGMALTSTVGTGLGLTAGAGTGLSLASAGTGLGLTASAGTGTALTAGAGAGAGIGSTLAAIPGWGWALGALALLAGSGFGQTPGEQTRGGYYSSTGREATLENAMTVTGGGGWADGAWARDLIDREDAGLKTFTQQTVDGVLAATQNRAKALGMDIALGIDAGFAANLNGEAKDGNAFGYAQIFANGELAGEYSNRELGSDVTAAGAQFAQELADAAAEVLLAGTDFGRTGETASATLVRLGDSLTTVNSIFDTLGTTLFDVSLAGGDMAGQLADAFGGLDNLTALTSSFYENFYTEGERAATTTRQVSEALADLGISMPESRDAFRDLVEAQDLTTESGRTTYAALMQLAPAFASVEQSAVDAARSMSSAWAQVLEARGVNADSFSAQAQIDTAWMEYQASDRFNIAGPEQFRTITQEDFGNYTEREQQLIATILQGYAKLEESGVDSAFQVLTRSVAAQRQLLQRELSVVADSVGDLTGLLDTIRGGVDALYAGVDSVAVQRAQEGRNFIAQAATTARTTGYLPEADALQQAIEAVTADPTVYASRTEAERARLQAAAQLAEIGAIGGDQLDTATQQLRALERQIDQNEMILESAQAQFDAIKGLDTSVLSVADAVRLFYDRTFELGEFAPEAAGAGAGGSGSGSGASGGFATGGGGGGPFYATQAERLEADIAAWESAGKPWTVVYNPSGGVSITGASEDKPLLDIQEEWLRKAGVPGFAVGGYYPGGLALVGEKGPELINFKNPGQVYTADQTMRLINSGSAQADTRRLEALVAGLTAEVQALRNQVGEGNRHAQRTANAVNGNPEAPVPVELTT